MTSAAPYQPQRHSRSEHVPIRHQRYHVRLWGDAAYADMHLELLALMQRFELCYPLADHRPEAWLAPQLLPAARPAALPAASPGADLVLRDDAVLTLEQEVLALSAQPKFIHELVTTAMEQGRIIDPTDGPGGHASISELPLHAPRLVDRKSTRLNSSHPSLSRMPSSA